MKDLTEKIENLTREELVYILAYLQKETLEEFPELTDFFSASEIKDIKLNFSKKDANQIREELLFLTNTNSEYNNKIEAIINKEKEPDDDLVMASDGISYEMVIAGSYLFTFIINKVSAYIQNQHIAKKPTIEYSIDKNGKEKLIIRDYLKQSNNDLQYIVDLIKSKKSPAEIIKVLEKNLKNQNGA